MATDRRAFIKAAAAAMLLGPMSAFGSGQAQRLLSCRSNEQGQHFATLFSSDGQVLLDIELPARGHGITLNPEQTQAVVFARRPGDFMIVIDLVQLHERHRLSAREGRHLYGHGSFSADAGLLYATENAYESGGGQIGIYACDDGFRRVGELDSHGIGPHELRLMNDGQTLVVANGGIRTHPDMPRAKLNLSSMQSSLVYLDSSSGRLVDRYCLPATWQQLSIRHLDVSPTDKVAIAMQYEGPKDRRPPLVALHSGETELKLLTAPDAIQSRMRNYCGSIAFERAGSAFAVSSPRGGIVTRWSAEGTFRGHHEQQDVCGIAEGPGGLWFSDGLGRLWLEPLSGEKATRHQRSHTRWDNHLTAV